MAEQKDEGRIRQHESTGDPRESDVTTIGRGESENADTAEAEGEEKQKAPRRKTA